MLAYIETTRSDKSQFKLIDESCDPITLVLLSNPEMTSIDFDSVMLYHVPQTAAGFLDDVSAATWEDAAWQ